MWQEGSGTRAASTLRRAPVFCCYSSSCLSTGCHSSFCLVVAGAPRLRGGDHLPSLPRGGSALHAGSRQRCLGKPVSLQKGGPTGSCSQRSATSAAPGDAGVCGHLLLEATCLQRWRRAEWKVWHSPIMPWPLSHTVGVQTGTPDRPALAPNVQAPLDSRAALTQLQLAAGLATPVTPGLASGPPEPTVT